MRTTLVIPCFNESERLQQEAFTAAAATHPSVGFVFVNDGSRDDTAAVLQSLSRRLDGRGEVLNLPVNVGKAEAVRAGMLHAFERSDREIIGFWDADLATPFSELPRFLEQLRERPELEMVIGSRVKLMGRDIQRRASRHYLGRVAATAISRVLSLAIYDTQCGAKLFRRNDALAAALREPFVSRWIFDVELIARYLRYHRERGESADTFICELPLLRWVDVAGSKVRGHDFVHAGWDLLRIARRYKKKKADL